MVKGIFVLEKLTPAKAQKLVNLGADAVFVNYQHLNKDVAAKLHQEGIRVYIEVGIFVGEGLLRKYPDARPIAKNSQPMEKIDWYAGVCPNHPRVRREKLALIKRIAKTGIADGIWLDFIRYPGHWEGVRSAKMPEYCFCRNCRRKFARDVGGTMEGEPWIAWKCQQITDFVARAKEIIKTVDNSIRLGIFSVPWREEDYDGAIRKIIGQDFRQLAPFVDVFSPMVYQKMTGHNEAWIEKIVRYMDKVTQKPVLPIIQTENKPGKLSPAEFEEELIFAYQKPSQGSIVFFWEDLQKDQAKLQTLKHFWQELA